MHENDRSDWQVPKIAGAAFDYPRSWLSRRKPRFHSKLEFSSATAIMDKLSGCRMTHIASGAEVMNFDHDVGPGHEREINKLIAILGNKVCPLGIAFGSAAMLLLSDVDDVFLMGYQEHGLKYVDRGFDEALRLLVEQRGFPWILIDPILDPDGLFYPDVRYLQDGVPIMLLDKAGTLDRTVRRYSDR